MNNLASPQVVDNPGSDLSEAIRLLSFAQAAAAPNGFVSLDGSGAPDAGSAPTTLITARMTYCFSIGALLTANREYVELAKHGVGSLLSNFLDTAKGGFFAVSPQDTASRFTKDLYSTSFVLLAANAACAAGIDQANMLRTEALSGIDRFWDPRLTVFRNSATKDFSEFEDYLGANGNMHAVEALISAGVETGDQSLLRRALQVSTFFIDHHARAEHWLLPEHYSLSGQVLSDYNIDAPFHEFRPYGVTIGHLFEWSRLLLELRESLDNPPNWLTSASDSLYRTACELGWVESSTPGFLYTVDWDGRPVSKFRPHWVLAEAISAAATKQMTTVDASVRQDLERWQLVAALNYVDLEKGSWHHELDEANRPSHIVWSGKPDIYHALQAVLLPQLGLAPSLVSRIKSCTPKEI